ncbi:alpha/beta-hydrolase [Sarocladium strictum]
MASPSPTPDSSATPELVFKSLNKDRPTTVILLHGGFTGSIEYEHVVPHLSEFHLLLPDLPLHGASRHITPGTTENSAQHVAQLIRSHAHGGKAHVVGVSMGGYIGQCLALDQPNLVLSLFITGAAPLPPGKRLFMAQWTSFTYYTMKVSLQWLPDWVYRYQNASLGLTLSDELIAQMRENITWPLVRDMFPWVVAFSLDQVQKLKVRTLSIAGAKEPKGDDVPMIQKTAEALRSRRTDNGESWPDDGSGAVVLWEATHGWDMQFPELFAQGVSTWVKGEKLPDQFVRVGTTD